VTPRALQERAGETADPFSGLPAADVFVVPLDRDAETGARAGAERLRGRIGLRVTATRSFRIDVAALDERRHQLDALALLRQLAPPFRVHYGGAPSLVIGVTSHDVFNPQVPRWRFAFNELAYTGPQSYAAISIARLGGRREDRRVLKFLLRDIGLLYYGLPHSRSRASVLWAPILSLADVDRLGDELGDPPYTRRQLAAARARRLRPEWRLAP
jgi:hypothetical protein